METYLNNKLEDLNQQLASINSNISDDKKLIERVKHLSDEINGVKATVDKHREINKFAYTIDNKNYEELHDFIGKNAKNIFNSRFVFISTFDPDQLEFKVVSHTITPKRLSWLTKLINFDVKGMTIKVDEDEYQLLLKEKIAYFSSLHQATKSRVSEKVGQIIDHTFNTGWIMSTALISDARIFGILTIMGQKDQPYIERESLISFTNIAAQAIKRKQLENLLLKGKANLDALLQNTENIIWAVDKEFNIFFNNPRFKQMIKKIYGFDWVKGQDIFQKIPEQEILFWKQIMEKAINAEQFVFNKSYKLDGKDVLYQISVNPIIENQQVIGISFFGTDLSLQKKYTQLEQELQLAKKTMEIKQNFLANMSHELRTPLAGVLGLAELLKNTPLNSTQQEYLNMLFDSGIDLKELIELVLDYSNLKTKVWDSSLSDFSLHNSMTRKVNQLSVKSNKDIQFSYNHDYKIPEYIYADETLIVKILDNLLENAYKYTNHGEITLSTRLIQDNGFLELHKLTPALQDEIWIRFDVNDTGKGVNNYVKEHIFKPFMNLENNCTREVDGTGLGLALCKEIVDILGGKIGYESTQNKGSRFWFVLKVKKGKRVFTPNRNDHFPGKENELNISDLKIGCACKGAFDAKITQIAFRHVGCEIITIDCETTNVMKTIINNNFDIVLFDLSEKECSRFLKTFRGLFKNQPDTPEIIGIAEPNINAEGMGFENINFLICKPFKSKEIKRVLNEVMKKRQIAI